MDLAKGHVKAIQALNKEPQVLIVNLGTGIGYSVINIVEAFIKASGKDVPFRFVARRDGDPVNSYADISFAKEKLNWEAKYDLSRMCEDEWRWRSKNSNGHYKL